MPSVGGAGDLSSGVSYLSFGVCGLLRIPPETGKACTPEFMEQLQALETERATRPGLTPQTICSTPPSPQSRMI